MNLVTAAAAALIAVAVVVIGVISFVSDVNATDKQMRASVVRNIK